MIYLDSERYKVLQSALWCKESELLEIKIVDLQFFKSRVHRLGGYKTLDKEDILFLLSLDDNDTYMALLEELSSILRDLDNEHVYEFIFNFRAVVV